MENNFYTAVSPNYVAVFDGETALGNSLYYWMEPICEVYKVETLDEATVVARQAYSRIFNGHPAMFGVHTMALPATGTFAVQTPPQSRLMVAPYGNESYLPAGPPVMLPQAIGSPMPESLNGGVAVMQGGPLSQGGAWSLVWLSGYAVLDGIGSLIENISQPDCLYPHATWWGNTGHAALWAQREYAERVSCCFDVRDFYPAMPDRPVNVGERYINPSEDYPPSDSAVFQKLRKMGIL